MISRHHQAIRRQAALRILCEELDVKQPQRAKDSQFGHVQLAAIIEIPAVKANAVSHASEFRF